ncbi:formate dehydrogenase subunit alpha [Halanaerobiaceae bacterium Z-7014]|uniref:Formate dehydrogenase subunit alpha n=1 Tax=Halonatronomonas betaini TaxID=2778430 RepID=A0A931F7M9_9FIRM|nr:formate dehydrogenase subunit alpha [Halonatronomonas betaini]MBF8435658.1 formate dehydrogenase subunit alpha [Halonatronomonas betaini]
MKEPTGVTPSVKRKPDPLSYSELTEDQVMLRTFIAMCIPAILAVFAMGTMALFNILAAVITAVVCHYIIKKLELQDNTKLDESTYQSPYSALVAGMIVGLCMGEFSPYWITAIVSAVTMVGFKWGQEKYFGRKIINPAAGAKMLVLLLITFMWFLPDNLSAGMLFYPEHLDYNLLTKEGFEGALALTEAMGLYGTANLSVPESLLLFKSHGWIGGASSVAVIASGVLLAYWIKLKWRITVSFLGGMAVLATAIALINGGSVVDRVAFHVFAGSVIFLAFYMATEPQTTPSTFKGQYIFGGILAILTMGLTLVGLYGASFVALVILNPYAPYIDRIGLKDPFPKGKNVFSPGKNLPREKDETSPVMTYDESKCIMCQRCVKACDEIHEKGILGLADRGSNIFTTAGLGERGFSECDGDGQCFELCPTGALAQKHTDNLARKWEAENVVNTICSNCGTGCNIRAYVQNNRLTRVESVVTDPNNGSLCIKGRFGNTYVDSTDRLLYPMMKRGDEFVPVTWDKALDIISSKLSSIKEEFGPDAIAGVASAKSTNEESYLFQKFMRTAIGTNNIDSSTRLCDIPSAKALEEAFGCGAMTNSITELEYADCILVIGSNTTASHPVVAQYIKKAVRQHGADLIVIDPKEIELTKWATKWIRPKNGSDLAVINGMMNVIKESGLEDQEFIDSKTEGYADFIDSLSEYTPEKVSEMSEVPVEELEETAKLFAGAEKSSIVFATGMTQQENGTDNVRALANLSLMTGNIGKESTGLNQLQGQNNIQGINDMGALPDHLPGYINISKQEVLSTFSNKWDIKLPEEPGLTLIDMMDEAAAGNLKSMIVMGSNLLLSEPNRVKTEMALDNLDFLVVVDPFMTETAEKADLILPAAISLEKEGTFTNTERRIQKLSQAMNKPGKVKADWEIIAAMSKALGYPLNYNAPENIMDEIASVTPLYRGVSYRKLGLEGIQWPIKDGFEGTPYLYKDRFLTENGKAKFKTVNYKEPEVQPTKDFPYLLLTGRSLFHVRTGSMTRKSEVLKAQVNTAYLEINPEDAERLDISDNEDIKVSSKIGEIVVKAKLSHKVKPGSVFLPIHFSESAANKLTDVKFDKKSGTPALKRAICQVEKISEEEKSLMYS